MKKLSVIFLILMVLLMAVPAATMPLFANAANTEKRRLSEVPPLIREDGSFNNHFSVEMNTWIQEHIGLRNWMISANSRLRTAIFKQGATDDIVVGKEGWLFYHESVDDYLHVPTISVRSAMSAAHTAAMLARYASEQGSRFLLAFLPNKNTVYGDKMPYYYMPRQGAGNREIFLLALEMEQVPYVDVTQTMRESDRQLYQKMDSHWTYEGALLAYRRIMEESGLEFDAFENMSFTPQKNWPADLAVYLFGEGAPPDVQQYPDYTFTYGFRSRTTAVDSLTLETERPGGRGSLVIYRDSFLNTMQVYMAQNFERALFSRSLPYQAELIGRQKADLTILQMTERSLPAYVHRAPLMPAPQVDLEGPAREVDEQLASCHQEETGPYIHLFGAIDESLLADTYQVFLLLGDVEGAQAFEAFPIYEKDLLGEAPVEDNGWSIYMPAELMSPGTPRYLCIESGQQRYLVPLSEGEN